MNAINAHFCVQHNDFNLDIKFSLPSNGISALFGASGSGKTTCLRAMAGLERLPNSYFSIADSVWQDSQKGIFVPPHLREIGYVFQEASLFTHLNVQKNLNFGRKQIEASKRKISFKTICELLGLNKLLNRPIHALSGGEQQRVAIARALLTSPKLLLMDEPLSALDNALKQDVLPYLEKLHERLQLPIIYVSHSVDEVVQLADYLVLIHQGKKIDDGPIDQVMLNTHCNGLFDNAARSLLQGKISPSKNSYLTTIDCDGLLLYCPKVQLQIGQAVRCSINARDISLSLLRPKQSSALSILNAVITSIEKSKNPAEVDIKLQIGKKQSLRTTISYYAKQSLNLHLGDPVWAEIKNISLL